MKKIVLLIVVPVLMTLISCGGAEERKTAYLEKAKHSLEIKDYEKARIELKNVLQIDPKEAKAYFHLGEIYEAKSEFRKAFSSYNKASDLEPNNLDYQAKIGYFFLFLGGEIESARKITNEILAKDANHLGGLLLKSGLLLKDGKKEKAKAKAIELNNKYPADLDVSMFLSRIYVDNKDYSSAVKVLEVTRKEIPDNIKLVYTLATVTLLNKDYDRTEELYKEILAEAPDVFSSYASLANFYKTIDKFDKSEDILRQAIKADKSDITRKLVLIRFIQQQSGVKAAIAELQRLIKTYPDDVAPLRLSLGNLYEINGKSEKALETYKTIIADYVDTQEAVSASVLAVNIYRRLENNDAAKVLLEQVQAIAPNDVGVNFIQGKIAMADKDFETAVLTLRSVIKNTPENIDAQTLLAVAHISLNEREQAKTVLDRAFENNRSNAKGLMSLVAFYKKLKSTSEIEKHIDAVLALDADHYLALNEKSSILNAQKKYDESSDIAARMIKLKPNMKEGYIQSLPKLVVAKDYKAAVTLLEDAYEKTNKDLTILQFLSKIQIETGELDKAEKRMIDAVADNKDNVLLYLQLASIQFELKKIDAAINTVNKGIEVKPDYDKFYIFLSNLYRATNKSQQSIDSIKRGLAVNSKSEELNYFLAMLYLSKESYEDSLASFEKVLAVNPKHKVSLNNMVDLLSGKLLNAKNLEKATSFIPQLLEFEETVFKDTAAWVYYKNKNYSKALDVIEIVIKETPDIDIFNYHAGMIYLKLGKREEAKQLLVKSLASKKPFDGRDIAVKELSTL